MRYTLFIVSLTGLLGQLAFPARAQRPLPLDSVLRAVQTRNPALRQYDYRAQAKMPPWPGPTPGRPPKSAPATG